MHVSLNWLKRYVDYGELSPEALAEKITKSGIEVDGIEYVVSEKSEHVVVGYVKSCEQHPNADKLKLCQVDVGEAEHLQIICGAANVGAGQKVVVAKPGAVLPGNLKIKKVKLRGIESNGMICSMQELSVGERFIPSQFAEGIVVLPDEAVVGESVVDLLNLNDAILEFDLTPNRADALNMMGVAYEVAAILDVEVNLPTAHVTPRTKKASDIVAVKIEDELACPYYGAYVIQDVTIAPSPLWMQNYLLAAGVRPINNVVDITNFVLFEYGQPLHAFDFDLVGTGEIVVRRAKKDETLVTLDKQERHLSEKDLLITDGKRGIALAGVMGGLDTEVNNDTTTVLLEAAFFDGVTVRQTVTKTGLRSDASTRFEKGVDPNRVREAGLRACALLEQYADGNVLAGVSEVDQLDRSEKTVAMNASEVNRRLGTEISIKEMEHIVTKLRFSFTLDGDDFIVTIPTRRGDVVIFEDMLEEVARIYGYDNLPYTLPANASKAGGLTEAQLLERRIKQFVQGAGLSEAITYALVSKKDTEAFLDSSERDTFAPIALAMPMSEDHHYLRRSLLPELLNRLTYNVARKQKDVALYEVGSVYLTEETALTKQPVEQLRLAAAMTGTWVNHPWQMDVKQTDFYVLKGILEGLFGYINRHVHFTQANIPDMHPGRCANIEVDGKVIGFMGQVHPAYAKERDLKDTFVFELNVAYLLETTHMVHYYESVPKYPSVLRDIAFVVKEDVAAGAIKAEMERVGAPLVKKVEAFDLYRGDNVAEDEKSVAFNVHYQDPEKTLTDKEVDESFQELIQAVNEKFSAYVRS